MRKLSCTTAKQIDLVEYLAALGFQPQKIRNQDYWYLSPLRKEKTPSFKVNRNRNIWFDFGEGTGGDMIDFGCQFFKCSIRELLELLSDYSRSRNFSFHPHTHLPTVQTESTFKKALSTGEKEGDGAGKINVLLEQALTSSALVQYLQKRCIPMGIAQTYLREIHFELYGKTGKAIGFKNNKGGFELRNEHFKGSSSPKAYTFYDHAASEITVFEGFFDFLSFLVLTRNNQDPNTNFLVLNSLSFFHPAKELMDRHQQVNLYLDGDGQGRNYTRQAIAWNGRKYKDRSTSFRNAKDLNEWFIQNKSSVSLALIPKRTHDHPSRGRRI